MEIRRQKGTYRMLSVLKRGSYKNTWRFVAIKRTIISRRHYNESATESKIYHIFEEWTQNIANWFSVYRFKHYNTEMMRGD